MITIKINGKEADIFSDMKIPMKLENPLFVDTFINEGYSYSFSLPKSPRNKLLLIKNNVQIDVFYKGVFMFKSFIREIKENNNDFSLNIINEGKDYKQKFQDLKLNQLNLDSYIICEESDDPIIKTIKWSTHMENVLLIEKAKRTHVFPPMFSNGYSEYNTDITNILFQDYGGMINRYFVTGEYLLNFQVPNSISPYSWITTVAPCPTGNYILNKILEYFGLKIRKNELLNVPEFLELYQFNNYVLDKIETSGSFNYNVHGLGFDLKNHVSDVSCYDFLAMLNELYNCKFNIENSIVDIVLSKNEITKKSIDVSKYASENFIDEKLETPGKSFSYTFPEDQAARYRNLVFDNGNVLEREFIYPFETLKFPFSITSNEEIELNHLPLPTACFPTNNGFPITYDEAIDFLGSSNPGLEVRGFGMWNVGAFVPYFLKSDLVENDSEIFSNLQIGYFRDKQETFKPGFDEFGNPDPLLNELVPIPYAYSFKETFLYDLIPGPQNDLNYSFPNADIYYSGPKSCFSFYSKPIEKLIYKSTIKTKLVAFPFFELKKQIRFKEFKHTIQQKKQSFTGYVKTIYFTLTNQGISPAEVDYIVPFKGVKGEWNDDWNEDYTIE